jgi:YidC/Oxa1 family membrane protein insertase
MKNEKAPPSQEMVSSSAAPLVTPVEKPPAQIEKLYVLENDYQQVVFSSLGGAVAEINLPFKTKENQSSIILPIEFDTILKEKYPQNAYFPSKEYLTATSPKPLQPTLGGYSPLFRRTIAAAPKRPPFQLPPSYYALNILSEDDEKLAEAVYAVKKFEKDQIVFEWSGNQRKITKTYRFAKNQDKDIPYSLLLDIHIEGNARGLMLTSGVPEVEMISGAADPDIKYRYERNQKVVVDQLKLPKDTTSMKGIATDWVCNANGFFGIIINAITEKPSGFEASYISGTSDPTRLTIIDAAHELYPANKYPGYLVAVPLKTTSKTMSFRVFAGPFEQNLLKQVDAAFQDPITGISPDFAKAQSFHGWFAFISEPFAKFLFIVMKFFYSFTHSWAFSIILLTAVLKLILYPLNNWSMRSMTRMQMIAPEVQALKTRFSKDPKRANLEIMQLYKERGVSPFSGCLPMVIQMPFLVGMFDLLKSAFQLRGCSFIPGWIDNLTSPDVLFSWDYPIFFIGTQFHLLPFILGGLMFLQQKCTTWLNKENKAVDPEAQRKSNTMGNTMTIVFTLLFYHFPSGLNIYWISSTALGILQQLVIATKLINEKTHKKVNVR